MSVKEVDMFIQWVTENTGCHCHKPQVVYSSRKQIYNVQVYLIWWDGRWNLNCPIPFITLRYYVGCPKSLECRYNFLLLVNVEFIGITGQLCLKLSY